MWSAISSITRYNYKKISVFLSLRRNKYVVLMDENSWLQEHIRSMNDKLTELVGITATHSMALKILGAGLVIVAGAICGLIVKWIEGKL